MAILICRCFKVEKGTRQKPHVFFPHSTTFTEMITGDNKDIPEDTPATSIEDYHSH
jgi:hypothetical protein